MNEKRSDVTILCRVVDNYGDIGFVYRLSRNLSELAPQIKLRLVVSNLESFSAMAPGLDPFKEIQQYRGWTVLDWNSSDACTAEFTKNPPTLILECFQCSRPQWLEDMLFAPDWNRPVQIVNIEYLTAESWADDFHLLKSGTRSILVKKVNFMPGFTKKTGGLVIDSDFASSLKNPDAALLRLKAYPECEEIRKALFSEKTCISLFTYQRDFSPLVRAMKKSRLPICIFLAPGLSRKLFLDAWEKEGRAFDVVELSYMAQEDWDALLTLTDLNIIRGEDSFARACLCGKAFLWNAYVQDDEFQLEKVRALLERIKVHFSTNPDFFENYGKLMIEFNKTRETDDDALESSMLSFLLSFKKAEKPFADFGRELFDNGNLTEKLLDFIN